MPAICVTELKSISPIAPLKSHMVFLPAALIAAGIAVLSLTESTHMPSVALSDKVLHGLSYALLSAALMGALVYNRHARIRTYLYVCLATTAYGILMEALQRFCTLTRTGEMADVYADCLGAIIGVLLIASLYYGHRRIKRPTTHD